MKALKRLQEKWKLGTGQFWLVILTFALGGSLSGRLCSFLLKLVFLEKNWAFWLVYPLFLTILWPFSVIFVSFFTGQFAFFKGYLTRVGSRLLGSGSAGDSVAAPSTSSSVPIHIAIFASGAGSNARKIIEYFENNMDAPVSNPVRVYQLISGELFSKSKYTCLDIMHVNSDEPVDDDNLFPFLSLVIRRDGLELQWTILKKTKSRKYPFGKDALQHVQSCEKAGHPTRRLRHILAIQRKKRGVEYDTKPETQVSLFQMELRKHRYCVQPGHEPDRPLLPVGLSHRLQLGGSKCID